MPPHSRKALAAVLLTAGGFTCYWTYLTLNQGRLLFDARRRPPRDLPDGISAYSHEVPGGFLRGYVYGAQGEQDAATGETVRNAQTARDLLFYLPGRGEDVLDTMQYLAWLPPGVGFATMDYRGLGHSDGQPSEAAAVADASQFLLHLRRRFPGTRVHVVGRSLGTGVAIQLADLQDFESLQLITPYDSLLEIVRKRFPLVPLRQLMRHHFDSISHCKKVVQSTKVLLAEVDEVVPHECSERLIAAWPGHVAQQMMPGTNHFTIIEQPETWRALAEFAQQVGRPGARPVAPEVPRADGVEPAAAKAPDSMPGYPIFAPR
ncbi:alpha/beta hydrolase [Cupriavidus basilensis]|uniref:alpha/beta hydrolase n=1 Tax=Cupriavidus basilensis TaxID=68895 RepID=UPI0020A670C3|nr:alpha/beta hydrolase [Cupriavidus basilensis]MCP3019847.1 lysophospholipase [Cupriavidus basilensis]MDR3380640.1 alpha/beta hydrolase [Cupriavidus basilensis]